MVKMRFPHTITLDEETEKKARKVLENHTFVDIVKAGIKALEK